jgi:hypothetical protein
MNNYIRNSTVPPAKGAFWFSWSDLQVPDKRFGVVREAHLDTRNLAFDAFPGWGSNSARRDAPDATPTKTAYSSLPPAHARPPAGGRSDLISATIAAPPRARDQQLSWWTAERRRRTLPIVVLAIVIGIGLLLRLNELGARSLWVDELFTVGLAAQSPSTILTVLYGEEANMALYYGVMFVWARLVGVDADELWMRLPSVLFGVAGLWALYRLGTRLDGQVTGLVAAGFAAVNAYHVEMSQEARAYTMWALLATLSWDALIDALDTGGRRAWLRYVAWTTVAFYTHLFTLFVIVAQVCVVAMRSRVAEWRVLVASGVCVVALCTPFVPFFLANSDGSQILHVRPSGPQDVFTLIKLFAGASTPLLVAYTVLALLGAGVAVYRAARARSPEALGRAVAPLFWLLIPILTIFLLSYVKPMFKERYLFGAMPAFPLLAAIGLTVLRPVLVRPLVVLVIVGLAIVPIANRLEIRQSENWRGAMAYLDASMQPGDGAIFISKRGQLGYEYYAGWLPGTRPVAEHPAILEPFSWDALASSEEYYRALTETGRAQLPEFADRHRRIWLVLSHEFDSTFDGDTSESIRNWLTRRGYAARLRPFTNVRIILYERSRP